MKKSMQRVISAILSIAMLISVLPAAVFADEAGRVVYGSYVNGEWVQDPDADGTITDENSGITLSKIAVPNPEDPNKYTITLTVETSQTTTTVNPTSAATVLVIDTSGSMRYCAECGGDTISTDWFGGYESGGHESDCKHYNSNWRQNNVTAAQNRMTAAINAALGFVESYAGETANVGRWLAIVDFDDDGNPVNFGTNRNPVYWLDVSGGEGQDGYDNAVEAINDLAQGGGTNLDDGLYDANALLGNSAVSSVPAANKNVIALTDGVPTYYRNGGSGSSGSATTNNATAATAITLRGNASVYTVCFGVADEACYRNGPTVGEFLEEDIATPAGTDEEGNIITYAYNADNSDQLNAAFEAITDSITEGISGEGFKVVDPMSSSITLNPPATLPENIVVTGGNTIEWSLGKPTITTDGNTTYYTYTFSYEVEVNSSADGFEDGQYYPANGNAYLEIPAAEEGGETQKVYFPVPAVTGVAPRYKVTYDRGAYGELEGQDADGQVVHENIRIHEPTPAAPKVTPTGKYYFTGWAPAVAPTVTGDVTYVAQYASQYEIVIAANSDIVTYDGNVHTVSGYTVKDMPEGYTLDGVTAEISGTDAGSYINEVNCDKLVITRDGDDVTHMFYVSTEDGTLTINKREVTLTSATATREYNGTPLTNGEVTVTGDGWAKGEGATYTVTGSQTLVGSSSNSFSYELNSNTNGDNYTITERPGTLTVTDRSAKYEITVVAKSASEKYDGAVKSVEGFDTLTFTVEGNTYTVEGLEASANGIDAGKYPSVVRGTAVVKDAAGNDVTKQFTVKIENGELVINKRAVTLTSADDEKEYDGTPLTNETVTVSGDGFVEGEGVTCNVTGSRTLVGTNNNAFTYEFNDGTLASNYEVTKIEGNLTVKNRDTKYAITVEANSGEFKYDGTEHKVEGFKTMTFVVDGNTYTVSGLTASAAGTDVITMAVSVSGTPVVKDAAGNVVTDQFAVSTKDGELKITKRTVTLTSANDEKEYDGTPLTNDEITVGGDGFVEGEGATYNVTGSQTLPESSPNTFTYTLNEGTKADNYNITTEFGTLTIGNRTKKYEITVVANSGSKTYDGEPMTVSGFKTLEYEINGVKFTVEGLTASVTGTDAGSYTNAIEGTAVVRDADDNDVTSQFIVNKQNGTLTINKRNVTLTSASDEKQYDGTLLTNDEITINSEKFAEGEGATFDVTGSQRVVGSSENKFTYTLNENTKADNYNITVNFGTLTVTSPEAQYEVEVKANSYEDLYDGTEKTAEGIITDGVEGNTFWLNNEKFTLTDMSASRTETNAGEYRVNVTGEATVIDAYGNDVSDMFKVTAQPGTLKINKREVTLTSATDEKQYDGTPLTNDEVTVTGDGWADGEGAAYDVTGTQTLAGSSENFFTFTLNAGTSTDNYTINTVNGTLTVINREAPYKIEVVANSGEYLYDGDEKTVEGFETLEFTVKENGFTYYVSGLTAETTETDAGVYPVNVTGTPVVKDADGNDVTAQFAVSTKAGELKINKREVTLTSATESKEYDGTALTNDTVTVSGDGFADGEYAEYFVTGTRTLPGTSDNSFTYVLGEGTKAENYEITTEFGTLTITDRDDPFAITVEAKSGKFLYDGEEKVVEGFKTLEFIVNGLTYTVEGIDAYAEETDADRYTVEITGEPVVLDEDGNDVTGQFDLNLIDGTLLIEKRLVVITSGSDSKYADGKPLTNDEITETGDGWADGEGADYDVTGTRTLPGVSANTFTYELWDNTEASNYEIEVYFGELEVKETVIIPRPPMKGDVILNKVDSADPTTALAGAQFALYRAYAFNNDHDDEYIGEYTTNKYGIIEIEDLDPGRYFFVETRAPEGYKLDDTKHHFSITIGRITTVTVDNMKAEVPVVFGTDHYAYIIGYPDGGVHPEATITRAEVATIFFRLLSDEVRGAFMTDENAFSDVNDGDWFNRAVSTMAAMGVVNGYPDGTFRPNGKITRAEFAAIAARFDENGDTTEADFSDIEGHWGMDEISIAANNGWILGYTDNTFRPNKYITRAEAMTLVNRVLQRIVEDEDDLHEDMVTWYDNADTSKWYYLAVQEATNSHYYFRKLNGFETWIDIREVRDWTELEG